MVNGYSTNGGTLEICINGVWGTICFFLWYENNAQVACRQLGYSYTGNLSSYIQQSIMIIINYLGAMYNLAASAGSGSIFLYSPQCKGYESTLLQCPVHFSDSFYWNICTHSDDIAILCLNTSEELILESCCTLFLCFRFCSLY